jgi:hypothetical protein
MVSWASLKDSASKPIFKLISKSCVSSLVLRTLCVHGGRQQELINGSFCTDLRGVH